MAHVTTISAEQGMRWFTMWAFLLALLFATGITGCDLFTTREPEPPSTGGSTFESATTPSIVLNNLKSAITVANALDYRKCFSDSSLGLPSFTFKPSAQGQSVAPGRFGSWGVSDEEAYIRTIFAELVEGEIASLTLNPPVVTETPIGDSIRYTGDYSVRFPHTRPSVEREASGKMILVMKLSNRNEWYITSWQDIAIDDKPTWSLIKARFSN